MEDNTSELSDQQTLAEPAAPNANDDLTVAEHLRVWRQRDSGDGLLVFNDGEGCSISLAQEAVEAFIAEHGALHPGDYHAKFGRDWREDFATRASEA